jgi:hypothetical protein
MGILIQKMNHLAFTLATSTFITINAYEVMAIHNTQWILIHLYVVHESKMIPILHCVKTIGIYFTFDNILFYG